MSHDAHGAHADRSAQLTLLGGVPAETPLAPAIPAPPVDASPAGQHAKGPKLYVVPAGADGTRKALCTGKHCDAAVYWAPGVRFPISCDYEGCTHPTRTEPGIGVSHFVDCPDSQAFSGRNKTPRGTAPAETSRGR